MGTVWELDFYSRPIVDEQGKKRWEVLLCEGVQDIAAQPDQLFRYSKYLSSSEVNSIQLQAALEDAIAQAPAPPASVRFFRNTMQNMIIRACEGAGLLAKPSRRTLALTNWLNQRQQTVYPNEPGYQPGAGPILQQVPSTPQPLPDALVGQQWAFVSLEPSAFADMAEWDIDFGEAFPLEMTGLAPGTKVPGVIIFSPRATPLAAWMSGLEVSHLRVEPSKPPRLLLETGAIESWQLANLTTAPLQQEAENFNQAKAAANQVHFLAVQDSPDSERFAGFWLLQELDFG
jgi:hypothetical protein